MTATFSRALIGATLLGCVSSAPAWADTPVTVARLRVSAQLRCADGREAQAAHLTLSIPQSNGHVVFSLPAPDMDPYAMRWTTINPCSTPVTQLEVNVRNLTPTGFIATVMAPGFPKVDVTALDQRAVQRMGSTTLTLHSELLHTATYPTSTAAVAAALSVPAEYDARPEVSSRLGGIGPARSWPHLPTP